MTTMTLNLKCATKEDYDELYANIARADQNEEDINAIAHTHIPVVTEQKYDEYEIRSFMHEIKMDIQKLHTDNKKLRADYQQIRADIQNLRTSINRVITLQNH